MRSRPSELNAAGLDYSGVIIVTKRSMMVDKRTGQVEYAVLQFGGFLGLGSDYYPLPWDVLAYETRQSGYVVNLDKSMIEQAPRYATDNEPVFDQAYGQHVYDYYGVPYRF